MQRKNGISLIVLVITIIVMIIIAATIVISVNNMIEKAEEAAFKTEMVGIKQQVVLKLYEDKVNKTSIDEVFEKVSLEEMSKLSADLKKEIIYWGQYDIGVSQMIKEYAKNHCNQIIQQLGILDNLYYVPADLAEGKEKKYLYDMKTDILYKVSPTRIGIHVVHSIEELNDLRGIVAETLITEQSRIVTVDGILHYEPDLTGFVLDKTSIVYYDDTIESSITISAKEYLENGKQRTMQKDGKTYEFYDYNAKIWGNILVENKEAKSYWVWIPRYAYNINKAEDTTSIIFIGTDNKPLDGTELPSDYIVHPSFENGEKGIWVSKYEPVLTANMPAVEYPYYIPDMTGFDETNTYVEVYNSETQTFEETRLKDIEDIRTFAKENNWFNYVERVWANIKVVNPENGAKSWWVWIPRYAYYINKSEDTTSIIFVDIYNNPLDGRALPSNYTVHPSFGNGEKGIWVSKYEPVQTKIEE